MPASLPHLDFPQFLGFVAMAMWLHSQTLKCDRRLNIAWLISNFVWLAHYLLLGGYAGAVSVFLNALRSAIYLIRDWRQSQYRRHLFWALMVVYTIVGIWVARDWIDIFPMLACYSTLIAFFVYGGIRGRITMAVGNFGWLIYAFVHGSYGGFLAGIAAQIIAASTIYRLWRDSRAVQTN
jgi:hypothetical protein